MALANDNMWGYTTSIITEYKVRWIEAAVVQPCWTAMMVYYVEESRGHLMEQHVGHQAHRTAVHGNCWSVHMPWEDVVRSLHKSISDKELATLPRAPECLKYLLRLHLRLLLRCPSDAGPTADQSAVVPVPAAPLLGP